LFVEPPPARRVGGIETALAGMARGLVAWDTVVTRTSEVTRAAVVMADLIHFHGVWEFPHLRARRWCRKAGKPFVASPHGMLEPWALQHRGWKKLPYFHLAEKRSLHAANAILATSEEEARSLRQWFDPAQLRILPLGTEVPQLPERESARQRVGLVADEFTVLFLSRCHEKKGLHLLIRALPEVARLRAKAIHLVIVGDGDRAYVEALRRETSTWSGNLRASWTGAIWGADKWDYLVAADLFCLPSFSENFGLAILESLLAGTPVITTSATPWQSLRGDLPVALCEPDVATLTAALQAGVSAPTPSLATRDTTRATAIQRFNWSTVGAHYAAMYRDVRSAHVDQH
jgi:glycosyltransferase involved in cell wall biosynthesis